MSQCWIFLQCCALIHYVENEHQRQVVNPPHSIDCRRVINSHSLQLHEATPRERETYADRRYPIAAQAVDPQTRGHSCEFLEVFAKLYKILRNLVVFEQIQAPPKFIFQQEIVSSTLPEMTQIGDIHKHFPVQDSGHISQDTAGERRQYLNWLTSL